MPGFDELVEYFEVDWTGIALGNDGDDPDDLPDKVELTGEITFSPNVNGPVKYLEARDGSNNLAPFDLFPLTRKITIVGGRATHQNRYTIKLEAASLNGVPSDWNWHVKFDLYAKGRAVTFPEFNIAAVPGSKVNLTAASPLAGSTGTPTAVGPRGWSIISVTALGIDKLQFNSNDPLNPITSVVTIPALTNANASAVAAAGSASAASTSATAANASKLAAAASEGVATTKAADAEAARAAAVIARTLSLIHI